MSIVIRDLHGRRDLSGEWPRMDIHGVTMRSEPGTTRLGLRKSIGHRDDGGRDTSRADPPGGTRGV